MESWAITEGKEVITNIVCPVKIKGSLGDMPFDAIRMNAGMTNVHVHMFESKALFISFFTCD